MICKKCGNPKKFIIGAVLVKGDEVYLANVNVCKKCKSLEFSDISKKPYIKTNDEFFQELKERHQKRGDYFEEKDLKNNTLVLI